MTWKVFGNDVFPCESVAVQATVVVPIGKVDPELGEQSIDLTASSGSVAVTVKLTRAPVAEVPGVRMSSGTVTTGGVVSPACDRLTTMVKLAEPVLP